MDRNETIFWEKVENGQIDSIKNNAELNNILNEQINKIYLKFLSTLGYDIKLNDNIKNLIEQILLHGKSHVNEILENESGFEETSELVKKIYTGTQIFSKKSEYQHISIYDTSCGRILVIDGDLQFIDRDEYIYHEMFVHVPLAMKSSAKNVLVIGAGDGGVCRELLKHTNIEQIIQIEIDIEVVNACKEFFPDMALSMSDPKVTLIHKDASKWIIENANKKAYESYFDVVIMDTTDFNASDDLFDDNFFVELKKLMKSDSLLVFNGGCMSWYRDMMVGVVHQQKTLFNYCRIYQTYLPMYGDGHFGFIVCSDLRDPLNWIIQYKDFTDKNIITKYYTPNVHKASFQLPKNLMEEFYHEYTTDINLGTHVTIDFTCSPASSSVLNSVEELESIFDNIVRDFNLQVVGKVHHKFTPQGVTMCYMLGESHISIHTWPEKNSACLDIFSCRKSLDSNKLVGRVIAYFNTDTYKVNSIDRTI